MIIRRHGSVSALKCMRDEMHRVPLREPASYTRDYRISIMDSLGSNCIRKVFSFFPYVPYELRYCDAKSNLYIKFTLRLRRNFFSAGGIYFSYVLYIYISCMYTHAQNIKFANDRKATVSRL